MATRSAACATGRLATRIYAKAEHLVGINGTAAGQGKPFSADNYQAPLAPNPISAFAETGMRNLGMNPYRTPLAVITQDHAPSGRMAGDPKTSYVNRYGDPLGLKSNTWVSLLRPTLRTHSQFLDLRCNCVVTHLEAAGSAITKVNYRDPSGRAKQVAGKVVIVACSAIESARLLMLSAEEDLGNFGARFRYGAAGGLLGRYFLTHCFGGAEVAIPARRFDGALGREVEIAGRRFDKSISLDSDWATDFAANADWIRQQGLWAGGAIYNNTSDQALPLSLARTHRSTDLDTLWQGFAGDSGKFGDALVFRQNADPSPARGGPGMTSLSFSIIGRSVEEQTADR